MWFSLTLTYMSDIRDFVFGVVELSARIECSDKNIYRILSEFSWVISKYNL